MKAWRDLVTENPMLGEFYRRTRRFAVSKNNRQNIILAGVGIVVVFLTFALIFAQAPYFPGWGIACIKLPLFAFVVPLIVHGAVAGEREKRSWDAICCAPLTDAQVVAGKFLSAVSVIVVINLVIFPVELAAWMTQINADKADDLLRMFRLDFYTNSIALFLAAVAFLASARSRRPFNALGGVIGLVAGMVAVSVISMSGDVRTLGDRFSTPLVAVLNPIVHVGAILSQHGTEEWVQATTAGIPFMPEIGALAYLALGAGALIIATKTLHFADQEVIAAPRAPKNA